MKHSKKLEYTLKNNYLFLALMNSHPHTLKMLICSLLGMRMEDIISLEIRNPIEVGEAVEDKTFILDVAVLLNNNTYINIELQVVNYSNWPERSLGYLCRTYDNLNRGEDYVETKPAIHVSILDFTLFQNHPEFFASYRLLNTKNYHEYTSKFQLYVLDLTKIDMATKADKRNQLDVWSRIFQAETWGDLMAIATEYQDFQSTVEAIDRLTTDEKVRLQCEARERAIIHERVTNRRLEVQEAKLAKQAAMIEEREAMIKTRDAMIEEREVRLGKQEAKLGKQEAKLGEQEAKLGEQEAKLGEQEAKLGEQEAKLGEQEAKLGEQEAKLGEQEAKLGEQEAIIKEQNEKLSELQAELARLKKQ